MNTLRIDAFQYSKSDAQYIEITVRIPRRILERELQDALNNL